MVALGSSVATLVMEIVHKRYYFDPRAPHSTQWCGSLVDAGSTFHYCWLGRGRASRLCIAANALQQWRVCVGTNRLGAQPGTLWHEQLLDDFRQGPQT
jgi:hypothetical protein